VSDSEANTVKIVRFAFHLRFQLLLTGLLSPTTQPSPRGAVPHKLLWRRLVIPTLPNLLPVVV